MFYFVCFLWCIFFGFCILQYASVLPTTFIDPIVRHMNLLNILQGVLDGKYDDLSEQAFYMVGGIEEVIAKAEKIAKENAA